jgi:hypothetical protein
MRGGVARPDGCAGNTPSPWDSHGDGDFFWILDFRFLICDLRFAVRLRSRVATTEPSDPVSKTTKTSKVTKSQIKIRKSKIRNGRILAQQAASTNYEFDNEAISFDGADPPPWLDLRSSAGGAKPGGFGEGGEQLRQ